MRRFAVRDTGIARLDDDGDAAFDLVLMDLHMPGIDGLQAAARIRALAAEAGVAVTPIVALTANTSAEDRDACLAAGMQDFLTKPVDREQLARVLTRGQVEPAPAARLQGAAA
jgi:CheY-like chemotaxis protein